MKVMFLCTGNTCRSPLAQALMLDKLAKLNIKNIDVDSCGLNCLYGLPISDNSKQVLKEKGINFEHQSKSLTQSDIEDFDYIICMTNSHKRMLENIVPKEKLFSINDFTGNGDVSDPYGQSIEMYRKVGEQLDFAVDKIVYKLISGS